MVFEPMEIEENEPGYDRKFLGDGGWSEIPAGTRVKTTIGDDTVLNRKIPNGYNAAMSIRISAELHEAS